MSRWPLVALALVAACRPAADESPSPPPSAPPMTIETELVVLSEDAVLGCVAGEPGTTCGHFDGLPAISRDGRQVIASALVPTPIEGAAAPVVPSLSLDIVRASDGKLLDSMPLVTGEDHRPTEAPVEPTIEDRLAAANARLATMEYRPLVAVPERRNASQPLWFELDEQGRVSVHDADSGRALAQRDLALRCVRRSCRIHARGAWLDPELSFVVVQVVSSSEGSERASVSYAAIQLPLPP